MSYEIPRILEEVILRRLETERRIVLLYGPRQSGKTTLARKILSMGAKKSLYVNGEDPRVQELWASLDLGRIKGQIGGFERVCIDEAQRIPDVARALKLLFDEEHPASFLVTGSSSLDIARRSSEALTGRTWTYTLYPISFVELAGLRTPFELEGLLPESLVLGMYPGLVGLASKADKIAHLEELSSAYLYKDVLELGGIRNPRKLRDLLRLLAYQVGSEVSYQELGRQTAMSADTVISYIDLLEKAFVVFKLGGYGKNLRKEVTKKDKVYFFDNGIRNALIDDFKDWELRADKGALWENFLVSERRKANEYSGRRRPSWFWRTHTGAELDYVEEFEGRLLGFEFKLSKKASKAPSPWLAAYPDACFTAVSHDSYLEFIVGSPPAAAQTRE
ncbi:MAG: AAA ATPase [Spirochaetes bacterium]|nr:MAG: AAA ATPase [Spirochaetota bacterium]